MYDHLQVLHLVLRCNTQEGGREYDQVSKVSSFSQVRSRFQVWFFLFILLSLASVLIKFVLFLSHCSITRLQNWKYVDKGGLQ